MIVGRTELDKAIQSAGAAIEWPDGHTMSSAELRILRTAAKAHLDTLPQTRTIDVWHVEWASRLGDAWFPEVCIRDTMAEAVLRANEFPAGSLVRVTGPHKRELPT